MYQSPGFVANVGKPHEGFLDPRVELTTGQILLKKEVNDLGYTAIVNGTIYSASNRPDVPFRMPKGTILIENGTIKAVGERVDIPEGSEVIDVAGSIVTPGLFDAHCHIGIYEDGATDAGNDTNESSDPVTAEVRALDAINPRDVAFKDAIAAGVTCVQTDPGSANIIGGQTVVMKTWGSSVADELVIKFPSGMKGALGENPKRVYSGQDKMPKTRMGNAAVMRRALVQAQDYLRKKELAVDKPDKQPDFDLSKEALACVIRKEIPLRVHCHRADDILTAIRIAKEFDIDISLEHCTEGDKVLESVRASGFPVTMGPCLTDKSKLEVKDIGFAAPVALSKAGVKLALITDHPVFPIQYLRLSAGLAIREGMDEDFALLSITRFPAEIAGVSDRVGSIEPGKDADLAVWTKDPFEYDSKVLYTFIEGKRVYEATNGSKIGGENL
jgi:imidazolonepropionase-like amidohydrolase